MILVTGATGTVGGYLVQRLCAEGAPVRAVVRSPEKADALRGFDCQVVVAPFENPTALATAMAPATKVFMAVPTGPKMAAQEASLLDAVQRTAPQAHVVKLAAAGYDRPELAVRMTREHRAGVQRLVEAGLPHTVVASSPYMQNLLHTAASVQEHGILPSLAGQATVSYVDARDVAAVAAHVLTSEGHEGAHYTVTGPAAVTYEDLAESLSKRLGRPIHHVPVPAEKARKELLHDGLDPWLVDGLLELAEAYRAGAYAMLTDEVAKATGRPARSFEDFLTDHLQPFL